MTNLSCCGTECTACACYGSVCQGCGESEGRPFYVPKEDKACAIYRCAVQDRKYRDCSKCTSLPCDIWRDTRDPHFSDEEFEDNINERVTNLKSMME